MANVYDDWGFHENPFNTHPLEANERGKTLLVGREIELDKLTRRIETGPKIPTVEGGIGIGKTSLVNVAAFRLFRTRLMESDSPIIIPCRQTFQISANPNLNDFIDEVTYQVAQTLIEQANSFGNLGANIKNKKALNSWLNSPTFLRVQAGLAGYTAGVGVTANTGAGFDKSGFKKLVWEWLKEVSSDGKGGVVCIIDNMELLQESSLARQAMETLRDVLLNIPGLRWVLCGANGIIQSLATSPRLEGILYPPIEVAGIDDALIPSVLNSRIEGFEKFGNSGYLPITPAAFDVLYVALNRNLRNLLSNANDFCLEIADKSTKPITDEEKDTAFFEWIDALSSKLHRDVATQLGPRAWEVFDIALEIGGRFSPGDFAKFKAESVSALRPHVKSLEEVGVLQSARDDQDQRRKAIEVTSKGYMVHFDRKKRKT